MSALYGLNYYCDVLLYMASMGLWGMLWHSSVRLTVSSLLLLAAAVLSHVLTGMKRERLRFWPLALILPALWLLEGAGQRLLLLPMAVYLVLYVINNRSLTDYYYAAKKFRGELIWLLFATLLALVNPAGSWTRGLGWLLIYLAAEIYLLRMLRHEDRTIRSVRFRVMNLISLGAVAALGWMLSQPQATSILRRIGLFLLDWLVAPVLRLLLFLIQCLLTVLAWLLGPLMNGLPEGLDQMPQMDQSLTVQQMLGVAPTEQPAVHPLARAILIGVGVLLLTLLVLTILQALSRQAARFGSDRAEEIRESLDEIDEGKKPSRRRGSARGRDGVRAVYRQSLQILRSREGKINRFMDSSQILEKNRADFDAGALEELRNLYLPVRYGEGADADRTSIQRMKAACQKLKRKGSEA